MSAAPHHISKEARPHPSGVSDFRKVHRGFGRTRTFCGEIHSYHKRVGGQKVTVYWAHRRTDQLFHSGQLWAIELATVQALAPYGVTMIGIEVEDGEKLLIRKADLIDPERRAAKGIEVRAYALRAAPGETPKPGSPQYFIPVDAFVRKLADKYASDKAKLKTMAMKKGRAPKPKQ